jgi:hypothetical protein
VFIPLKTNDACSADADLTRRSRGGRTNDLRGWPSSSAIRTIGQKGGTISLGLDGTYCLLASANARFVLARTMLLAMKNAAIETSCAPRMIRLTSMAGSQVTVSPRMT